MKEIPETPQSNTSLSGLPEQKDWEFSELEHRPDVVLSVLEPDQLVVAKERTRFGPRRLSKGIRIQLWLLRIYVVVMLVIVAISVFRAIRGSR